MANALEVRGLRRTFASREDEGAAVRALRGIDLTVADGEFVAIVGPSGCGKSTLMKIISGFERPDAGAVRIDDVVRTGPSSKGIVISQHGSVFPWLTVQQNLMFGLNGDGHGDKADHGLAQRRQPLRPGHRRHDHHRRHRPHSRWRNA